MNETLGNLNGTSWQTVFIFCWFGSMSLIISILNTAICTLLWTQKRLHNISNLFFVNLAVADILVGFVAIPWKMLYFGVSPVPQWLYSNCHGRRLCIKLIFPQHLCPNLRQISSNSPSTNILH